MKDKISFWQLVFYICWFILGLWIVLKSLGIINTPFLLEFGLPLSSFIFGVFALYPNLLEKMNKLALNFVHLDKDVEILKKDMLIVKEGIKILKKTN